MPESQTITETEESVKEVTDKIPKYNVILLNDDDHTYDYVIEMLGNIFGHDERKAMDMAFEVDNNGRVIVDTTHKERAEFKKKQIIDYGPDHRLPQSDDSMKALVEPAG